MVPQGDEQGKQCLTRRFKRICWLLCMYQWDRRETREEAKAITPGDNKNRLLEGTFKIDLLQSSPEAQRGHVSCPRSHSELEICLENLLQ